MRQPPGFDAKDGRPDGISAGAGGASMRGGARRPGPVVGIAQALVDIEARVSEQFLSELGFEKGGWRRLEDGQADRLCERLRQEGLIRHEYAGGGVANTVHDYCVLSGSEAVLFGAIGDSRADSRRAGLYLKDPVRVSPGELVNTNGAGDAALAAVVHELVAARFDGDDPWRTGAERACITRSTFAEIARYASRVAHEIVRQPQARLHKGRSAAACHP
ncbi:MAG TPA: hypothetical protein DCM87_10655 [Planctomycetes bacterium]|nr:hypothetical protein [Planctomycetota bacterium]